MLVLTNQQVAELAAQLQLAPATVIDLLEHGWAYVSDERPGRWESFAYRLTK